MTRFLGIHGPPNYKFPTIPLSLDSLVLSILSLHNGKLAGKRVSTGAKGPWPPLQRTQHRFSNHSRARTRQIKQ